MRLVITGDKSRYHFFRSIVDQQMGRGQKVFFTEKLGERDVYLTSDISKVGNDIFYSQKVPLNTIIYFPKEYKDYSEVHFSYDRIILFDEFPYATDADIGRLNDILQKGTCGQVEAVLFVNKRESLESDISTDEMALDEAEERYREKKIPVYRYRIDDIPRFLLWSNGGSISLFCSAFGQKLKSARDNTNALDGLYDLEYNMPDEYGMSMSGLVDFDKLASFFSYNGKLKGNNAWKVYYENAERYYWLINDQKIKEFCKNMYQYPIKYICIWDFEKDFEQLYKFVKEEFAKQFHDFNHLEYNPKIGYDEFLNIHKEEVLIFKQRIQRFFSDRLKLIIKERVYRDLDRMEALVR